MTPMSVSVLGWIRSATQSAMIARSGNMQIAPMTPVKVIRGAAPRLGRCAVAERPLASLARDRGVAYNGGFRHWPRDAT